MNRKQRGFTLIELMVTIVVLGIAMGIALPNYLELMQRQKVAAAADEVENLFNLSRTEAVKRSARVSICASDDGATCGDDWSLGILVFRDFAALDAATAPIITQSGVSDIIAYWKGDKTKLELRAWLNGSTTNFIRYNNLGMLARINNASSAFLLRVDSVVCKNHEDSSRIMNIRMSGSIERKRQKCSEGHSSSSSSTSAGL